MRSFSKRSYAALLILLLIIGGVWKKVHELAAPPAAAKACDFLYPEVVDQLKPTQIIVAAPETFSAWSQKGGVINDASCLNKTAVYGVVDVSSVETAKAAVLFARENGLKVTMAGQRHSMGGQSFVKDGVVLDMRNLKQMSVDEEKKILTVQSGATWEDVQKFLDPKGLSVKAMQSINIFTVGGTISVNAHGIAHNPGPIASTIRQMHILTSDGSVVTASSTENADLFRHVIGGYGLFGVIIDVDLDVVPNEMYAKETQYMSYEDFPTFYKNQIDGNESIGLFYGRLSVAPQSYLAETAVHIYTKDYFEGEIPAIASDEYTDLQRFVINFSKTGSAGRWTRWMLEKYVEPTIRSCSRNQAMSAKEVCLVARNQEMYDSMGYLKNDLPDTDILQEYFIPQDQMKSFVDGLRNTVQKNGANLLNVTIRIVHDDKVSALPYAKGDRFAFVLYFNQKLNAEDAEILRKTTIDLIDVAEGVGGTYYLPYQLYYSQDQLHKSYPEIDDFFAQKRTFDPNELFSNTLYETYGKK